jgi:thymidylate kinase
MSVPETGSKTVTISAREFPVLVARKFADTNIRYCYVRWDATSWRQGQDIDVMLPEEQLVLACEALLGLADEQEGIVVNINAYRGRRHVMVALCEPDRADAALVEFDLQTYVVEGGVRLASASYLVNHTESRDSIQWPRGAVDAVFRLLRAILRRGAIKDEDWLFVRQMVAEAREEFQRHLGQIIGAGPARELSDLVAKDMKADVVAAKSRLVRARLELVPAERFREEKSVGIRLWQRVLGTIRPPGEFICLVGTDGAGKTTVGQKMAAFLCSVPYAVKYEYCGVGGGGGRSAKVPAAHGPPPSSQVRRLGSKLKQLLRPRGRIRKSWVLFRVMCGLPREFWHYLVQIRPTLVRGGVVIGDRYYYDSIANLYDELPQWFIRLVTRTFPGPTFVVHLHNTPAVIYRRKQERTPEEIERAIQQLKRLQGHVPEWREMLTDRPATEIAWQLLGELMRIRTRRQLANASA